MEKWEKQSDATRQDFKHVVDGMLLESKHQRDDFRAKSLTCTMQ